MHNIIPRSKRGKEWQDFSQRVLEHIEEYTVPQYGDKGEDQIADWSIDACHLAIIKYLKRSFSSVRPRQELLDILKIAHYSCFIHSKLKENLNQETEEEEYE